MKKLYWIDYYEKLSNYYYDNVPYEHPSPSLFVKWIEETFNCTVEDRHAILFADDKDHFKFLWRWM